MKGMISLLSVILLSLSLLNPVALLGQTPFPAAPMPGTYYVDYSLLLALHPLLANFDLVLGRHLRSDLPFGNMEAMGKISDRINALAQSARSASEKIQSQIDKLRLKQADIQNRIDQIVVSFSETRGSLTGEETRKILEEKLKAINDEIAALLREEERTWDAIMDPLYIPRAQSEALVNEALSEIDSVLAELSAARGGAIILDSDFLRVSRPVEKLFKAHTTGADPLSIRLFQSLLNSDLVGKVPDVYLQNPELRQYAAAMQKQIEESFGRNIAAQISRSPLFATLKEQRGLFLVGGQQSDLTKLALSVIFQRRKVRPEIAQRILSVIP